MASVSLNGLDTPVSNIFCIGRNYVAHAKELNNDVPTEPMVFLKPTSALLHPTSPVILPSYSQSIHYECELVILIKEDAHNVSEAEALNYVAGYSIGLDLTARDLQDKAKSQGHPWTQCKGFRGAACITHFVSSQIVDDPSGLTFDLKINGQTRQSGNTDLMIFSVQKIISHLSQYYGLQKGDLIYTGTPAGVGEVHPGDIMSLDLHGHIQAEFKVAA
ncbi:fumarylacetoacetate hydrolase family protein [Neisseriaceae bacterium CLB008]|nr:fumarylacetoacetate hydrolase family protein [Neisseriaceae bacterium]